MTDDEIQKLIKKTANYTAVTASNIAAEKTGLAIEAKVRNIVTEILGPVIIPATQHVKDHAFVKRYRETRATDIKTAKKAGITFLVVSILGSLLYWSKSLAAFFLYWIRCGIHGFLGRPL